MGNDKKYLMNVVSNPELWNRLLLQSDSCLPFISYPWIQGISSLFGYSFELVALKEDKEVLAIFCIYYTPKSGKFFSFHPSLTPYNSPAFIRPAKISDERWARDKFNILSAIQTYIKGRFVYPYLFLDTGCSDLRPFTWNQWNVKPAYTFLVDPLVTKLDGDIIRRAKKCLSEGYCVSFDWKPEIFVHLFRLTKKRQGFRVNYSDDQLILFLNNLKNAGLVWMATSYDREEQPHASWVQLNLNNSRLFNWNSATNLEFSNSGGTSLLVYEMLNHIKEQGFIDWDLCGADNPSVSLFKSKLGGSLQLYFKADFSQYSIANKIYFRLLNR